MSEFEFNRYLPRFCLSDERLSASKNFFFFFFFYFVIGKHFLADINLVNFKSRIGRVITLLQRTGRACSEWGQIRVQYDSSRLNSSQSRYHGIWVKMHSRYEYTVEGSAVTISSSNSAAFA